MKSRLLFAKGERANKSISEEMNAGLTKIAPLVRAAPKRTFVRPSMPVKGGQHYTFEPNSGPVGEKLRSFFLGGIPLAAMLSIQAS